MHEQTDAYRQYIPEGIPFEVVYRIGSAWEEILTYAEGNDIDLIVMGRQGHGSLQKVFFGNVTEKVARKAACPVLIVPRGYADTVRRRGVAPG